MSALNVTFVQEDGAVRALEHISPGRSLMEVAREAGVLGILGDCGGSCACGTCHVYVDTEWLGAVGPPDDVEAGLLDMVANAHPNNSRLSCQIMLRPELDGLKITVAPQS
jgi:ferredoxin, 2Fe-2S